MDIKIIYVNSDGVYQEHSEATDSIKVNSLKTANHELTDTKLGKLVGGSDAADEHVHDARYYQKSQVDSAIDGEKTRAQGVESGLSSRIGTLEADPVTKSYVDTSVASAISQTDEVIEVANVASLPGTGAEGKIYVAKDYNKLYRWSVVTLPESYDFTVGTGGNFATLQDALASASVQNGHKIKILNGTYSVGSAINITKQVKLYGESKAGVIFQTAATSGDPVYMFNVSTDNVLFKNMTIKHLKTSNTSVEAAINVSGGGYPQTRVAGFIMDSVRIEHMEFGIVIRGEAWKISNCEIAYTGPTNSTRRAIGVYGVKGNCFVLNTVLENNASTGNLRGITLTSTTGTNPNETHEGKLMVENMTQVGTLHQFISMDSFQGTAGGFDLLVKNNTVNETSAFVSLYGVSANFGDLFGQIALSGNSLSNNHDGLGGGKGAIGIDGSGTNLAFRSSALPVHASSNTLAYSGWKSGYALANGSSGSIVGYNSTVLAQPTASQDTSIPSSPSAPATPSAGGGTSTQYVELSAAPDLTTIQSDISSLGTRVTTAEGNITTLTSGLSTEQSTRSSADSALSSRISALEADPVTKTYVDGKFTTAEAYTDQKISDLVNGAPALLDTLKEIADQLASDESVVTSLTTTVANNLTEAKSYTDSKISIVNGRLDTDESNIASLQSGLSSLTSTVSSNLAEAKSYADTKVSTEASARESADNALDARLDALEAHPITASLGLARVGDDIRLDSSAAGDGLALASGVLSVNVDGSSIEINSDSLRVKAAGIKDSMIDFGTGVGQVSAIDLPVADSASLFDGGTVEAVLQELGVKVNSVGVEYTVGSGGVAKGDLVFISGNDTVSKYSNLQNADNCVGVAAATASAGELVKVLANNTKLAGILSGASAGATYYWNGSGVSLTMPSASGSHVYQIGVAKNASDLTVQVIHVKKNA